MAYSNEKLLILWVLIEQRIPSHCFLHYNTALISSIAMWNVTGKIVRTSTLLYKQILFGYQRGKAKLNGM